jgi:polar amino acid transport system substrate-binding protein
MDYGFLIYHKENPNRTTIDNAKSFNDLKTLSVIVQTGVGWEEDNIPKYIDRKTAGSVEAAIHYLFKRQYGDFLIMPPEQAKHFANKFGYLDNLKYKKVSFIPNSYTPFHLGIRNTHAKGKKLLFEVEDVLKREDFKLSIDQILSRYR